MSILFRQCVDGSSLRMAVLTVDDRVFCPRLALDLLLESYALGRTSGRVAAPQGSLREHGRQSRRVLSRLLGSSATSRQNSTFPRTISQA